MLDGSACPSDGLSLLVARSVSLDNFSHPTHPGQCVEYVNQTSVDYSGIKVDLSFDGINASSSLNSTIPIPDAILSAMRDSSGADNLSVYIHGDVRITYQFDVPSGATCTDNYV